MSFRSDPTFQPTLDAVVDELQSHPDALRELGADGEQEAVVDHLYRLAAEAHSAAEILKQRQAAYGPVHQSELT